MIVRRREIIKGLAGVGIVAGTRVQATRPATADALAVGFGLATDKPFAQGANARLIGVQPRSPDTFEALVGAMKSARGRPVFALVEPAMALLVEEAAMDCHMAVVVRFGLPRSAEAHRLDRSHLAGRLAASGKLPPATAKPALIALALR